MRIPLVIALALLAAPAAGGGSASLRPVQCVAAAGPCTHARAVARAAGVAVSPDGRNVYVRGGVGSLGSLAVFGRDPRTGRLAQLQCVARHAPGCSDGRGLETPSALAVPRDGRNLYVTAANGRAVGVYRRGPGGRLTAAGSVAGLAHPLAVAVSPDGRSVYVGGDRLWVFARGAGGALRQVDVLPQPARALAATDAAVYAGAGGGAHGTLVAYRRDAATGALTETARVDSPATPGIQQPAEIAVAAGAVYVVSTVSGTVTRFDPSLQLRAICRRLPLAYGLAVADRVYVAYRDGLSAFALDDFRQLAAVRLDHATGAAAAGRSVYAVSRGRVTAFAR